MKITTPVTETYNQIGKVTRANFLWRANFSEIPKYNVDKISGTCTTDKRIWDIKIPK